MANSPQSIKRARQAVRRGTHNSSLRSRMRTVIKDTLKGISEQGNILPKWAQSVLKMKPDNMKSWLSNDSNRLKLEGLVSGGSGTAGVAVNR